MRAYEFIIESLDDYIEDEAVTRGDSNLINTLETLRSRSTDTHDVPMIRVDSLINIIRKLPGTEMFSVENLLDAHKTNNAVKNLIKDIKDNKDGVKYVYLNTTNSNNTGELPLDAEKTEKTVGSMAKRTLSKK